MWTSLHLRGFVPQLTEKQVSKCTSGFTLNNTSSLLLIPIHCSFLACTVQHFTTHPVSLSLTLHFSFPSFSIISVPAWRCFRSSGSYFISPFILTVLFSFPPLLSLVFNTSIKHIAEHDFMLQMFTRLSSYNQTGGNTCTYSLHVSY